MVIPTLDQGLEKYSPPPSPGSVSANMPNFGPGHPGVAGQSGKETKIRGLFFLKRGYRLPILSSHWL